MPGWLKWGFAAFMAAQLPVSHPNYGPAGFICFCNVSLILTLAAFWTQTPVLAPVLPFDRTQG